MSSQRVSPRKPPRAAPGTTGFKLAFADEFLLAGVQAFVAFAVVLAREGFGADGADEGTLVGVGAEVGAEVVGAREFLGAEVALEGGGVFLHAFVLAGGRAGTVGVREVENSFAVRKGVCAAATRHFCCGARRLGCRAADGRGEDIGW